MTTAKTIFIVTLLIAVCIMVFGSGCHLHNGWPRWGVRETKLPTMASPEYTNSVRKSERVK